MPFWAEGEIEIKWGLPYPISVICNRQMVFVLVEAHLRRLRPVVEEARRQIPLAGPRHGLEWLRRVHDALVAAAPPKTAVVVVAARLLGFVRAHLRFSEILLQVIESVNGGWIGEELARENSML